MKRNTPGLRIEQEMNADKVKGYATLLKGVSWDAIQCFRRPAYPEMNEYINKLKVAKKHNVLKDRGCNI